MKENDLKNPNSIDYPHKFYFTAYLGKPKCSEAGFDDTRTSVLTSAKGNLVYAYKKFPNFIGKQLPGKWWDRLESSLNNDMVSFAKILWGKEDHYVRGVEEYLSPSRVMAVSELRRLWKIGEHN